LLRRQRLIKEDAISGSSPAVVAAYARAIKWMPLPPNIDKVAA